LGADPKALSGGANSRRSSRAEAKPENLIGDKAYDSDPLDAAMRA
jgi:hypothetical protein